MTIRRALLIIQGNYHIAINAEVLRKEERETDREYGILGAGNLVTFSTRRFIASYRWPRLRKANWNGRARVDAPRPGAVRTAARCKHIYERSNIITRDFVTPNWLDSVNCRRVSRMTRRPLGNYRRIARCALRHHRPHSRCTPRVYRYSRSSGIRYYFDINIFLT